MNQNENQNSEAAQPGIPEHPLDTAAPQPSTAPQPSVAPPSAAPRRFDLRSLRPSLRSALTTAAVTTVAAGGAFALIAPSFNSCRGATRSARLLWEQRSAEVDEYVKNHESADATNVTEDSIDASASEEL